MLKNKFQSNSGATILIALLFFLMCAIVGSIVLAAGSASAGRISGLVADEQSYYTVTSAAKLFKEEIKGQGISFYERDDIRESNLTSFNSNIKDLLNDSFDTIYNGDEATTYTNDITITPPSPMDNNSDTVTGTFTMDSNYNIIVILQVKGALDSYVCTVNATPISPTIKEKKEFTETVTIDGQQVQQTYYKYYTNISWNKVTIEKGA